MEAGTIRALSRVMEIGAMELVLSLVAAALRCLTQVTTPKGAWPKEGTAGASDGEDGGVEEGRRSYKTQYLQCAH